MRSVLEFRRLTSGQLAFDVSLAALCVLVRFWMIVHQSPMILVVLLMAAALAVRRLSPGLALGIAWLGAIIQLGFRLDPAISNLAILAVLYTTAAYGSPRTKWVGLISAGAGALVAAFYLATYPFFVGRTFEAATQGVAGFLPQFFLYFGILLGAFLATFGLSWTLGLLAKTRRTARESRIAQQVAEEEEARARKDVIVEQERNRIARDMHDVVAHSLAVVIAQADGARYAQANDPGSTAAALTTISTTAREALSDVRILLGQLRHSQGESPQPVLEDLGRLIDQMRSSGLTIAASESGTRLALGASQQLAIYRIVQEALTNALRHGDPEEEVQVHFEWSADSVELRVSNALPDDPHLPAASGHGLVGMHERAVLVGGWLTAEPRQGRFVVTAAVPLEVSE
jgi:signal transduction histidine kinase